MAHLLLVNPAPRKKRKPKMAKKHRTAAQKRATARMIAANRARRGGHKAKRKYASNPAPRKHSTARRRRTTHHTYRKRSYRRNPSPRAGLMGLLMPSLQGAAGAIGVDVVTGFLPLPLGIKVSPARHFIKALMGVGLGMVMKGSMGHNMARGVVTVAFHDAAREAVQMVAPSVQLGMEPTTEDLAGLGYYNPATVAPGEALGFYPSEGMAGMGEASEGGYSYAQYEA
jgi:hypothetical protein